jgi:hypothetical protein
LYASYDAKTRSMQYLPAELVVRDGTPPERLVDFTQSATRPLWEQDALPTTAAATEANLVSIRVTPLHDMYAQLGEEDAAAPFAKVKAEELTSGRAKHSTIQFLHAAQAGSDAPGLRVTDADAASPVRALELSSLDAIDAFIELYGQFAASRKQAAVAVCSRSTCSQLTGSCLFALFSPFRLLAGRGLHGVQQRHRRRQRRRAVLGRQGRGLPAGPIRARGSGRRTRLARQRAARPA